MKVYQTYGYDTVPTPCFVVEEEALVHNLEILRSVMDRTGCEILLAQKCYSLYASYPLIGQYLSGTTASGLYEARLGQEYMKKQNHVYSAAYRDDQIEEILGICDHVVFNSFSQWEHFKGKALEVQKKRNSQKRKESKQRERGTEQLDITSGQGCQSGEISFGIRINPECSTQEGHAIYDPCAPFSRMGVTRAQWDCYVNQARESGKDPLEGIQGLHFHTLCEQNADDLKRTLQAVEERFGDVLEHMQWLNMGGGHHITRKDYDIDLLVNCVNHMKETYGVQVILEPGEAVALNAGYLEATVLDTLENGMHLAILDTSAACHMPDVLEMPYTPEIVGAKKVEDLAVTGSQKVCMPKTEESSDSWDRIYRLGGPTCLAGDVIGDYLFSHPLQPGDRVRFTDMAIYSMVKTNTFNGMPLPSIAWKKSSNPTALDIQVIKEFGYQDFQSRLS